ncbi:MAG TPA: 3-phosphoshikimate 1-carboxyvinyltransferase [Polyangiaceae bacterium]
MSGQAFPTGPLDLARLPRAPELVWRVPGSKSITNRALLLAALAEGTTRLEGVLASDDTAHMRNALEALGVAVRDAGPSALEVTGGRGKLRAPTRPLFVGNSGTAVRFLAALAALVPGDVTLEGDSAMQRRPIQDLVDGLRGLGVAVDCPTGCPPLTVRGGRLPGGTVTMSGERSSQYFSALMLSGAAADGDIRIRVAGRLVSRPYVEITRRMVADFGGRIDVDGEDFVVRAGTYGARRYVVEPDASAASYPFALATATGGRITVPDLSPGALQGDYGFVEVLRRVGAVVSNDPQSTTVQGGALNGVDVDMHDISDTVMTLAAIAPLAKAPTRITNVANIRIKETDRLAAVATELERLGQTVTQGHDFLVIEPAPLRHAVVRTYGDHRMAMSFAMLGMAAGNLAIEDPSCVAKTYPTFWDDVAACYRASGAANPW